MLSYPFISTATYTFYFLTNRRNRILLIFLYLMFSQYSQRTVGKYVNRCDIPTRIVLSQIGHTFFKSNKWKKSRLGFSFRSWLYNWQGGKNEFFPQNWFFELRCGCQRQVGCTSGTIVPRST